MSDVAHSTYLTEAQMTRLLKSARTGRYGIRDHLLILMAYRHGMRVSELIDVRVAEVDLEGATLRVRRSKGSRTTQQPIEGDELRAIRAWLRERSIGLEFAADSPFLFLGERGPLTRQAFNYLCKQIGERARLGFRVHPHMLRHSCGYALANKGFDTRLIQDYLGHRNIRHTVIYTETNSERFKGMWRS
jgi:type 1 fimbriae regulatory protein FimB